MPATGYRGKPYRLGGAGDEQRYAGVVAAPPSQSAATDGEPVSAFEKLKTDLNTLAGLPKSDEKTRNFFKNKIELFAYVFYFLLEEIKKRYDTEIILIELLAFKAVIDNFLDDNPEDKGVIQNKINETPNASIPAGIPTMRAYLDFAEKMDVDEDLKSEYGLSVADLKRDIGEVTKMLNAIEALEHDLELTVTYLTDDPQVTKSLMYEHTVVGRDAKVNKTLKALPPHSRADVINLSFATFIALSGATMPFLSHHDKKLGITKLVTGGAFLNNFKQLARNMGVPLTITKPAWTGGGRRPKTASELQRDIKKKTEARENAKNKAESSKPKPRPKPKAKPKPNPKPAANAKPGSGSKSKSKPKPKPKPNPNK